ncbi:hypothetical protein DH2020_010185 [Rehmannia glutinosa]|uniref:Uncharacterized protein n=1 Tax=Rehmannia glutinosa TaxID=99300 RepID=A0ABR0XA12_REHGL
MAKSMRSKREKRLRAIRRELVEPIYDKKDAAKLAAQEAALAAPKLPVKSTPSETSAAMEVTAAATTSSANHNGIDVEMADDNKSLKFLKPIGQKLKRKIKIAKRKYRGKGKIRKKHNV